jgi:hypothetical protein
MNQAYGTARNYDKEDRDMTLFRKNLIDGEWVGEAGSRNINPSDTGDVVGEYASAGAEQAKQADDDQINGDNVVKQARYDQDQYSGEKRNQRGKAQAYVHFWAPVGSVWRLRRDIGSDFDGSSGCR